MFSTQALTNDKVYLLFYIFYMGDRGGDQIISIHMKGRMIMMRIIINDNQVMQK